MSDTDIIKNLSAPFPPEKVSWRCGSTTKDKTKGMALAYIDARDVMDRLDAVCGPGGWQNDYPHANGKTVCRIGVKINGEWVWKADGAGDSDIEAEKGALSDAFKRAAVRWGIGRYLYDVPSPWVALNQYKQIEPAELKKLEATLKAHTEKSRNHSVSSDTPTPLPPQSQKSPAQSKRDGDYEAFTAQIAACRTLDELLKWRRDKDADLRQLPKNFLGEIGNIFNARKDDLGALADDAQGDAHEGVVNG